MDSTIGIQKMHDDPTPRVGGVAIGVGLALPLLWLSEAVATLWMPVLLAACPAFIMGLWEDVTKRVPVSTRLLATMAAGVLGWWFTGVALNRVDVPGVDQLFHFVPVAVLFTAFAVSGAANAVNIVDGFNGLSGGGSDSCSRRTRADRGPSRRYCCSTNVLACVCRNFGFPGRQLSLWKDLSRRWRCLHLGVCDGVDCGAHSLSELGHFGLGDLAGLCLSHSRDAV
jgi:hypothetical protein